MMLFFAAIAFLNSYNLGAILAVKLLVMRNHFLVILLLLECIMIVIYTRLAHVITLKFASRSTVLFMFIVIMVTGASVGLAMVALVTRSISKERDLILIK